MDHLPLGLRLANAAVSYLRYLGATLWPSGLSVLYPFPVQGIAAWKVAGSVAALAAVSAFVLLLRRSHPWLAVGWAWYVLTLLPVIGIVQVGMQARADRYMYVPMIGLLIAAAWESAESIKTADSFPQPQPWCCWRWRLQPGGRSMSGKTA